MNKDKLALGCGDNFHGSDWVHLDISSLEHVDVTYDLEQGSLPFEDNSFKQVRAVHVLEHLTQDALVSILEEIDRVCVPGAKVKIVLPHFLSWNAADLDHYRAGSKKTFVQFTSEYEMNSPYPDLFEEQSIKYDFLNRLTVDLCRLLVGDDWTAAFIPNAVNEIQYNFRTLRKEND